MSIKNIKRWSKGGIVPKIKSGRRIMNPEFEKKVISEVISLIN